MCSFERKKKKQKITCEIQIYFKSFEQIGSEGGAVHPGAVTNSDTPNIGEASNGGI